MRTLVAIAKRAALLLLLVTPAAASESKSPKPCGDFEFGGSNFTHAREIHQKALLFVKSGDSKGTAFLIDALNARFLTARHVVLPSINDPSTPITGKSGEPNASPVKLHLLDEDEGLDVAVIQAEQPHPFQNAIAFELSLSEPSKQSEVTFPGLALAGDDDVTATMPSPSTFEFDSSAHIVFRTTVLAGDSGSPVFTSQGLVVGVILNSQRAAQATAVPMMNLAEFLMRSPVEQPSKDFENAALQNSPLLRDTLKPDRTPPAISNLNLAVGLHLLAAGDDLRKIPAELVECPIVKAATDRGLNALAYRIISRAAELRLQAVPDPRQRAAAVGRTILARAQQPGNEKNAELARFLYHGAATNLLQAIGSSLEAEGGARLVSVFGTASESPQALAERAKIIYAGIGLDPPPNVEPAAFNTTSTSQRLKSDQFAALLHDYYVALSGEAQLSRSVDNSAILDKAIVVAGWAALVSRTPGWQAANYRALADTLM